MVVSWRGAHRRPLHEAIQSLGGLTVALLASLLKVMSFNLTAASAALLRAASCAIPGVDQSGLRTVEPEVGPIKESAELAVPTPFIRAHYIHPNRHPHTLSMDWKVSSESAAAALFSSSTIDLTSMCS